MSITWVDIMKRLPDDLLKPAEKGQLCYHVIVKETVAEQKLQRAAQALARYPPLRDLSLSEQKAIASLFKMVLAAATEPAGMCHIVDSHDQFSLHCSILALEHMLDRLTFSNAWSGSSRRDLASASGTESQPLER